MGLRILSSRLLLGREEIAQKREHHEEHYHDDQAAEAKAEELAWG